MRDTRERSLLFRRDGTRCRAHYYGAERQTLCAPYAPSKTLQETFSYANVPDVHSQYCFGLSAVSGLRHCAASRTTLHDSSIIARRRSPHSLAMAFAAINSAPSAPPPTSAPLAHPPSRPHHAAFYKSPV
ncbi:hypothetical protein ACJJTC_017118 [Scirpophaga incertulas]